MPLPTTAAAADQQHSLASLYLPYFEQDELLSQFLAQGFSTDTFLRKQLISAQQQQRRQTSADDDRYQDDEQDDNDDKTLKQEDNKDVQKLESGLQHVQQEISRCVAEHSTVLLKRINSISSVENELQTLSDDVQKLSKSVKNLHTLLAVPYLNLKNRLNQMNNICASTDMLRRVNYFVKQLSKVDAVLQPQPQQQATTEPFDPLQQGGIHAKIASAVSLSDMSKYSSALFELEQMMLMKDDAEAQMLRGIDVVDLHTRRLRNLSEWTRRRAKEGLQQSMRLQDQSEIANALQVFFNLQMLPEALKQVVQENLQEARTTLAEAFRQLSVSAASTQQQSQQQQRQPQGSELTVKLSSYLSRASTLYQRLWHLDQALSKKRDAATQAPLPPLFYKTVSYESIAQHGWKELVAILQSEYRAAVARAPVLKDALSAEHPDVLNAMREFQSQLQRQNYLHEVSSDNSRWMSDLLKDSEQAYLSRLLSSLFSKVDLVFASLRSPSAASATPTVGGQLPAAADIGEVNYGTVKALSLALMQAIQSCRDDAEFLSKTAKTISKTLVYLSNKVEQLAIRTEAASLVPRQEGSSKRFDITIEKQFNALLFNVLSVVFRVAQSLYVTADAVLVQQQQQQQVSSNSRESQGEDDAAAAQQTRTSLKTALETLDAQARSILNPVMQSIIAVCEDIVADVHQSQGAVVPQLESYLRYTRQIHLAPFDNKSHCFEHVCRTIATKILDCAAKQFAMVRSHAAAGEEVESIARWNQLAAELARLEHLISVSLFSQPNKLQPEYQNLRSFRAVLFLSPQQLLESTSTSKLSSDVPPVPKSLLLHHMLARASSLAAASSSPIALQMPHECAGLSPIAYYRQNVDSNNMELIQKSAQFGIDAIQQRLEHMKQTEDDDKAKKVESSQQEKQLEEGAAAGPSDSAKDQPSKTETATAIKDNKLDTALALLQHVKSQTLCI